MSEERKRRVSITKLQRQTAAGTDLIALCQTITEDGSLADEEVAALRQWLVDNREVDLPAKDFLYETVEKVVADGIVTPEERRELYRAIEGVLPLDIRDVVRAKRKVLDQKAKEQSRADHDSARVAAAEARVRNQPIESWDFMVAGTRYEGRPKVISRYAKIGETAYLVRDSGNAYSRHAVEVRLPNGMQIGFVPEEDAVEMAPLLDSGNPHQAHIKKVLTGGRSPIPVVVASVYPPDAARDGLVLQSQVPIEVMPTENLFPSAEERSPKTERAGCTGILGVLALLLGGMLVVQGWWK